MQELVDNLDVFLEMRLNEEFTELRESIEEVRKDQFGRKIFEAYSNEYRNKYLKEDTVTSQLEEAKTELEKVVNHPNLSKNVYEIISKTLND